MEPDLDDTRLSVPQGVVVAPEVDLDDTVARIPGTAVGDRETDDSVPRPPALVEPPAPAARELPLILEPILADGAGEAEAARRAAGALRARLPGGDEVTLDVTVYVGRKPSVPRIHTGPAPRLVTMPSPGRELSATHLELTQVGGALVASDMRSTNGTVVQLPGAAPRTLIRGESAVIVAGTRIDLGEGAVLEILPPPGEGE